MKVKVTDPVLDYEGKPIKTDSDSDYSYRLALFTALNSTTVGEILTAEDKSKIFQITTKIYASNEPDFTDTERVFIKERAAKVCSALVLGRINELFDERLTVEQPVENNN